MLKKAFFSWPYFSNQLLSHFFAHLCSKTSPKSFHSHQNSLPELLSSGVLMSFHIAQITNSQITNKLATFQSSSYKQFNNLLLNICLGWAPRTPNSWCFFSLIDFFLVFFADSFFTPLCLLSLGSSLFSFFFLPLLSFLPFPSSLPLSSVTSLLFLFLWF